MQKEGEEMTNRFYECLKCKAIVPVEGLKADMIGPECGGDKFRFLPNKKVKK